MLGIAISCMPFPHSRGLKRVVKAMGESFLTHYSDPGGFLHCTAEMAEHSIMGNNSGILILFATNSLDKNIEPAAHSSHSRIEIGMYRGSTSMSIMMCFSFRERDMTKLPLSMPSLRACFER